MKFGILSDVHGNLEALEVALNFLDKARVDDILFLGDAVGYGPNPNEVCALLRERCVHSVIGNHDAAAIGTLDTTWFHRAAAESARWTASVLEPQHAHWLEALPYRIKLPEFDLQLTHGSPIKPEAFDYLVNAAQLTRLSRFEAGELPGVSLIGHSHLTVGFSIQGGWAEKLRTIRGADVIERTFENNTYYIQTCGSVGQPRDGDPRLGVAIYDTMTRRFELTRLSYDWWITQEKIYAAPLDDRFGARLAVGQ